LLTKFDNHYETDKLSKLLFYHVIQSLVMFAD